MSETAPDSDLYLAAGGRCVLDGDAQWHQPFAEQGRRLDVSADPHTTRVAISPAALRHTLDVLVTNALQHGAGRVGITAAPTAVGATAIDITDEGPGFTDPDAAFARHAPGAAGHGIGLALARSLIEAEGGRLLITHPGLHPTIRIIIPTGA